MRYSRRFLALLSLVALLALAAACASDATPLAATPSNVSSGASVTGSPATGVAVGTPSIGGLTEASFRADSSLQQLLSSAGTASLPQGIWVSGRGAVTAEPDIAILTVGVEARADTVAEARSQAAVAMAAVIDSLKSSGVADKDIQTVSFSVNPQYTYREVVDSRGRYSEQVLVGYQVSNQASAKIRDLDAVGPAIDGAAEAGGDLVRIRGISFTIDDSGPLHILAREAAVNQAMATAAQFADLTGVTMGKLLYITETSAAPVAQVARAEMAMAAPALDASTPISGGELQVQITVQAVFAIL